MVAPDCSITSGATIEAAVSESPRLWELPTPIGTAHDGVICHGASCGATGDPKIGKLDATVFVGEDVCSFYVAMDNTLVMEISETIQDL